MKGLSNCRENRANVEWKEEGEGDQEEIGDRGRFKSDQIHKHQQDE